MYNYLQEQNLLCDTQFGFRKGLSTDLAILKLVDWVNGAVDKGLIPAALLLDIKKAFDTVDHHKLLQILESFGVRNVALQWFRSHLINRAQVVQNTSTTSECHLLPCGVPQGSIVGPLLFLIYIDYSKYYLSEANIIIFADDTLLFVACENLPSLFKKMEIALTVFISQADSQYLTLNYGKTNYILFSRIGSVQTDLNLIVKNNILNRVKPVDILDLLLMRIFRGMNMLS